MKLLTFAAEGRARPGALNGGTPAGVGFRRSPPVFLQDRDEIVCEVEKIGALRNRARVLGQP